MFVKFNAMNDAIKILVSALVIVLVNEASKRSTTLAAILLALPIVSVIAFTWKWTETANAEHLCSRDRGIVCSNAIPASAIFIISIAQERTTQITNWLNLLEHQSHGMEKRNHR